MYTATNTSSTFKRQLVPRPERIDLGNGLVMRWSTAEDKDAVAECLATSFQFENMGRNVPEGQLPGKNEFFIGFTRRLMSGEHPHMSEYDFALVEDTTVLQAPKPGQSLRPLVVAVTCLMLVSGYFGSVDMEWGMPGAVGSLPAYRNRGLVRRMFLDLIHPAAEARGDLMLFIPGIPYFYKQFGYENAVPAKSARLLRDIVTLYPSEEKQPRFVLREATSSDIPYLIRLSQPNCLFSKAELGIHYDLTFWKFVVETLSPKNISAHHDAHHHAAIVVDSMTSKDVGISLTCLDADAWNWKVFTLDHQDYASSDGAVTYRESMASVLSQLKEFDRPYYECYSTKLNNDTLPLESEMALRIRGEYPALDFTNIGIDLTPTHPVTLLLDARNQLGPVRDPYRFYTRIPSLPKFLLKIAPVLEARLQESAVCRDMNARLQVNFYQRLEGMSGRALEMVVRKGKIVEVLDWKPKTAEQVAREAVEQFHARNQAGLKKKEEEEKEKELVLTAGFRPLSFTRLVTGSISVDELLKRDMENYVGQGEARLLLDVLFPARDEFHLDLMWS
ncbi:hypothetical protein BG015_007751 [Linnemannia schmuckeri]|uniref:Uncharacterized protein n=1 Tax=Linnemannia schmuckeri TaxID=64567 RepID=A0A9P5RY14_9FUNG|nr:hypothetical protein BG015_007751 [Linnemannia schmuckeri]